MSLELASIKLSDRILSLPGCSPMTPPAAKSLGPRHRFTSARKMLRLTPALSPGQGSRLTWQPQVCMPNPHDSPGTPFSSCSEAAGSGITHYLGFWDAKRGRALGLWSYPGGGSCELTSTPGTPNSDRAPLRHLWGAATNVSAKLQPGFHSAGPRTRRGL